MAESGPGAQTSEFSLTKLVVWFSIAMTIAGAVLPHVAAMFTDLHAAFPDVSWLGKVGPAVTVAATAVYTLSRYLLKAKTITTDAQLAAQAQALKVSPP